jgi:hypothetical protein
MNVKMIRFNSLKTFTYFRNNKDFNFEGGNDLTLE